MLALIARAADPGDEEEAASGEAGTLLGAAEVTGVDVFAAIRDEPGNVSVKTIGQEAFKLGAIRAVGLPDDLFADVAPKVLAGWRARVAAEAPSHLRSHPHEVMVTVLAAYLYCRHREITDALAACQAASLLTITGTHDQRRFFVHRWTATELATRAGEHDPRLHQAHEQAAAYWRWRFDMWPQDKAADVHDLLEARHHLLRAGQIEKAGKVTESICLQLQIWGAWDQESALIYDTLTHLPDNSPRRPAYTGQLGNLAYLRGDYDEAARQYQASLAIFERLGDQAGMATSYHQLGMLAHDRGDYDEAIRQYQASLAINERLGDQARHGRRLAPARHARPGPRGLRRGRPPVPGLPRHQRAARQPGRHSQHLLPDGHPGNRTGRGPPASHYLAPPGARHQAPARQSACADRSARR